MSDFVGDGSGSKVTAVPRPDLAPDSFTIASNAREAGCYTFLGETFIIATMNDVDQPDPEIVRQIRVFDTRYVPLWVRQVYKTPGGSEIVVGYHVIGRYIEFPKEDAPPPVRLEVVPIDFNFPADKIHALRTLCASWPRDSVEYSICAPPAYVKYGSWVKDQMEALHAFFNTTLGDPSDTSVEKLQSIMESMGKSEKIAAEKAMEEARYRMHHNWPQMKKAIDAGRWQSEIKEPNQSVHMRAEDALPGTSLSRETTQ